MALPDGVTTCMLRFGPDTDYFGDYTSVSVKATPNMGIIHSPSGQRLLQFPYTQVIGPDEVLDIPFPHVDQPDMIDDSGESVTGWHYTVMATYTLAAGGTITISKNFAPVVGQTLIDFDRLISTAPDDPFTIVIPPVTSVNGMSGDVTLSTGAADATQSLPGTPIFAEDFSDPDGTIIANGAFGRTSKTGQQLTADGATSSDRRAVVRNGWQTWMTLPINGTPIGILGVNVGRVLRGCRGITKYLSNHLGTDGANAVIGVGGGPGDPSPSFAHGSQQMYISRTKITIFCVQNPIVDPYPQLATVNLSTPLNDGDVIDMMLVHDAASHQTIGTVITPSGEYRLEVPDARVSGIDYWSASTNGRMRFGWQLRRSLATDGEFQWGYVEAF